MQSSAETIEQYLAEVPIERASGFDLLRKTILDNLPIGFEEVISYGMIGYIVPHSLYPKGYHRNTNLPWPLLILPHKSILLRSIIWVFTLTSNYCLGL